MPDPNSRHAAPAPGLLKVDRLASFRVVYVAVFAFLVLYVFSVKGAELVLDRHFRGVVADAIEFRQINVPVTAQIQARLDEWVSRSAWVRIGGVRISTMVLARDGLTWIYVGGKVVPPPPTIDLVGVLREAERLLPATAEVQLSVPHNTLLANGILVFYAAVLLQGLFFYNRSLARSETRRLTQAQADRDAAASRTGEIERELHAVRERLLSVEPSEQAHADEIQGLQTERRGLQQKLTELARREEELRGKAARAIELDQERQALEDLLEEASSDLTSRDEEIRSLHGRLKRAGRADAARAKEGDLLGRRIRALYKNLEIDERAVADLVGLRDETMKLKAEEVLKRLSDEADNVATRRKVGGLPGYMSVFELGFAGKGRIYYAKGRQRRFRVLTIGAKNTQKPDLEYLSRLPRSEFT